MATLLTIDTFPTIISTAYNPVNWHVSSTDPDIRAVRADIYIDGTYSSTINGVRSLGTTDEFDFDVRKIMQADLVSELRTNITSFIVSDATASAKTVKIRLFEIIEVAGVFTSTWLPDGAGTNYLESTEISVVNMAMQHQEVLTDWTINDNTKKLLTLSLDNKRIPRDVPFQVGFLSSDIDLLGHLVTRDEDLGFIGITLSPELASLTSHKGIIEVPSSLYASSNVAYVDLTLYHNTGVSTVPKSITYRYKIVDYCSDFTLFFQNHLGDFDHFDFGNKIVESISTSNQRMEKPLTSGFSSEDAGISTVSSNNKTKVEVYTSELSDNELIFLKELIKNHTVVYKWDSAGVFLSYVVTSHSTKVVDTEELINFIKITLQPSNEHIVQNGD